MALSSTTAAGSEEEEDKEAEAGVADVVVGIVVDNACCCRSRSLAWTSPVFAAVVGEVVGKDPKLKTNSLSSRAAIRVAGN